MPISKATPAADNRPPKFISSRLSRKEQERALADFYSDPVFRKHVKILKSWVPISDSLREAHTRKRFLAIAKIVLSRWGLHRFPYLPYEVRDNYKWLAWLWRHWDLNTGIRPTLPVKIREPQLAHWKIQYLEAPMSFSADASDHRCHANAWATITFFPGISRTQAIKAAELAYDLTNRPMQGKAVIPPIGGRPGATEPEVKALRRVFDRIGLSGKAQGQRPADKLRSIRKAIENSSDNSVNSLKHWSDSTIANHYRKWRTSKGAPPRGYSKDPVRQ